MSVLSIVLTFTLTARVRFRKLLGCLRGKLMFICYLKAIAALFDKWCIILSYQKQDEVMEEKVLQCF